MEKKDRRIGNIVNDIDMFIHACRLLERPGSDGSLASVARKLKISPSGLAECLKRLRLEFGTSLIETHERFSNARITEAGRIVYQKSGQLFELHKEIKGEVEKTKAKGEMREKVVKVSTSPYLLAHLFPAASSAYMEGQKNSKPKITIECEEGYHTSEIIDKLLADKIDFAVLWNYPEKIHKIREYREVTCAVASESLQPVLVFGKDHPVFKPRLDKNEQSVAYMDELAAETLFVLEPDHQPLVEYIPDVKPGGHRIQFTTISSMIGSIRAGLSGVAIIPGVYKELDRYRRDGSLYFLPLKSRKSDAELRIEILYVFRGSKRGWDSKRPPNLEDSMLSRINHDAKSFLLFIEKDILPNLLKESGWKQNVRRGIPLTNRDVLGFKYAYHVAPHQVGRDMPRWYKSVVDLKVVGSKSNKPNGKNIYGGSMEVEKGGESNRLYRLEAELIDQQIFCLKGFHATEDECFVATFGILSQDGNHLIGVANGQDDARKSPMVSTFILSKMPEAPKELEKELQLAKNRTLIRTDVYKLKIDSD